MDGTLREWNIDDLYSKGKVIYNSDCGITCLTLLKDHPILLIGIIKARYLRLYLVCIGLESGKVIEIDTRKIEEIREVYYDIVINK